MIALFQSPNFSGLQCNPRRSPATEKDWRFSPLTSRVFNVTRHQNFIMAGKSMFQSPSFSGLQCNKSVPYPPPSGTIPFQSPSFSGLQCNQNKAVVWISTLNGFSPLASRVFNVTAMVKDSANSIISCFSPLASRVFNVTDFNWHA